MRLRLAASSASVVETSGCFTGGLLAAGVGGVSLVAFGCMLRCGGGLGEVTRLLRCSRRVRILLSEEMAGASAIELAALES